MTDRVLQLNIKPQEAIDILCQMAHRAEKTTDRQRFFPSYVPIIRLSLLDSPNTQVLYGRNGTGKTHILRTYAEFCAMSYHSTRKIPVYFDMRQLDISRLSPHLSPHELATKYYNEFIKSIVDEVERFLEEHVSDTFLHTLPGISKGRRGRAKNAIKKIRRTLDAQSLEERISNRVDRYRAEQENSEKAHVSGSASVTGAEASAGFNASKAQRVALDIEASVEALHAVDFATIRNSLDELIEDVGATEITLLLDEWSQIDIELQPIIAEFLRRTVCVSNKINLKLAALKYLTKFSSAITEKRKIGFQFGVDISELTDLNRIYTFEIDQQAVRNFLFYILFKHFLDEITHKHKIDLDETTVVGVVDSISDLVFGQVFESYDIFEYFVKASEGNPRDFLAIIGECCASNRQQVLPISKNRVSLSAINHFTNVKSSNFDPDIIDALPVFEKIFQFCIKEKSKIFCVSSEVSEKNVIINELWHQRLIHIIEKNYTILDEYMNVCSYTIYSIDYGKLLSLRNTSSSSPIVAQMVNKAGRIVRKVSDTEIHRNILNEIEKTDTVAAQLKGHIEGALPSIPLIKEEDEEDEGFSAEELRSLCVDNILNE